VHRAATRVLTATALALSALVATTASTGAAAPAPAHARKAEPTQVRIGTYNIISRATVDTFKKVITQVKPSVDVLALQEIGLNDKNKYLISDFNWGYYRPPQLQQNPVIWDRTQLDFVSGEGVKLSDGHSIEGRNGGGEEAKTPNWATVVRLFHRATGQQISIINVHLLTGTVKGGKFVPGRPRAKQMYLTQLKNLIATAKSEQAKSNEVFVMGDFNSGYKEDIREGKKQLPVKQFKKKLGWQSMWAKSPLLSKSYGTHSNALIDQIYHPGAPVATQILTSVQGSDHRPAVGTYQLPVPDPTYVAPLGTVGFAGAPPVRNEYTKAAGKFVEIKLQGDFSHGYYQVAVDPTRSTAVEGQDFYIDDTSFLPGSTTIYVKINKDGQTEPEEYYTLQIVNPVNMQVIPGSESVTGVIEANKS
jgi:endonuclease/exonuclease/phosphatase (EEP) superfamily protein YafD